VEERKLAPVGNRPELEVFADCDDICRFIVVFQIDSQLVVGVVSKAIEVVQERGVERDVDLLFQRNHKLLLGILPIKLEDPLLHLFVSPDVEVMVVFHAFDQLEHEHK